MKVAIVNDSKMAAEILRRIVTGLPDFTLLWTAYSGEEALELYAKSRPDIVLMDLVMPGIDGAETTRRIMQLAPCVILAVTATTVGNRNKVFDAMGYGALDAVNTPVLGPGQDMQGVEPLIQKLRTVSRLVGADRAADSSDPSARSSMLPIPSLDFRLWRSGPQPADRRRWLGFSRNCRSIFRLQCWWCSMSTSSLRQGWRRGCGTSSLPVCLAQQEETLRPAGDVCGLPAPANTWSMPTAWHTIRLCPWRPRTAPPLTFSSPAWLSRTRLPRVGVLLTGMGRDGAEGLPRCASRARLRSRRMQPLQWCTACPKAAAELNGRGRNSAARRDCSAHLRIHPALSQSVPAQQHGAADCSPPSAGPASSIARTREWQLQSTRQARFDF